MSRVKSQGKKARLRTAGRQTRWAPFWTVPKKYGKKRVVHPSRHTAVKRSWRRIKLKA